MRVPLTVADFLNRAALVYGHRVAVVDEPAPSNQGLWLLILVLAFVLVLAAVALEIIYLTPLVRHTGSGRGLGLVVGLLAR